MDNFLTILDPTLMVPSHPFPLILTYSLPSLFFVAYFPWSPQDLGSLYITLSLSFINFFHSLLVTPYLHLFNFLPFQLLSLLAHLQFLFSFLVYYFLFTLFPDLVSVFLTLVIIDISLYLIFILYLA